MCHGYTVLVPTCLNSTEQKVQLFLVMVICTLKRASSQIKKAKYIALHPEPPPSAMQQWVNSILRGEPIHITIQNGRNFTELMQAFYMSADQDRSIELPL